MNLKLALILMLLLSSIGVGAQSFSRDTIDFGIVHSCDTSLTREARVWLRVPGSQTITEVKNGSELGVTLFAGLTLTDSLEIVSRFAPHLHGVYESEIQVVLSPSGDTAKLVLRGSYQQITSSVAISGVDFGVVDVGATSSHRIVLRNTGLENIDVLPLENVVPPFSVIDAQPPLPTTLAPDDSVVVMVQYEYAGPGRIDNQMHILRTIGACPTTTTFSVQGHTTGVATPPTVLLFLPANQVVEIGEEALIPVDLRYYENIDAASVFAMHIEISYNATMLKALRVSDVSGLGIGGTLTEASPGKAVIELTSTQPLHALTSPNLLRPLFAIQAKTYLGNSSQTSLHFDSVSATGLIVQGSDGSLTMLGACAANANQIQFSSPVNLVARYTGDDNIVIEFTTLTDEPVSISIYDLHGELRSTEIEGTVRPASYHLDTSAQQLESGSYIVVMEHGMHVRTAKVVITR